MSAEAKLVGRWRSLLSSYNGIACRLDRELHSAHDLTMSEFETLDRLVGEPGCDKRRMQDLAADMYLSQSALSRAVARLEGAGLVARTMCDADRRGIFVTVTPAGRERHTAARATQLAILDEMLG